VATHPRCFCGAEEGERHESPCPLEPCTCGTVKPWAHGADCPIAFEPNPGPQTRFFESTANEVLYGGAAGGGKSQAAIALPLRWVEIPGFNSIVVRRTTKQLVDLLKKAEIIYPRFRGRSRTASGSTTWIFPSGATVLFTHLQHEKNASDYDGHAFQLEVWDELPHFTEQQYRWLRGRIRGTDPRTPRYSRATANPPGADNPDGLWVFRRYGAWLDPECEIPGLPKRPGLPPVDPETVLWFLKDEGSDEERVVPPGTLDALSRTFIPASLADNPALGDEYRAQLRDLDPVRRAQLLRGDWLIRPVAGAYFRRGWFKFVAAKPLDVIMRVRRWDLAATEKTDQSPDPDWTRGVLMSKTKDGLIFVEDVVSLRGTPRAVRALIKATAQLDGRKTHIRFAQDPGQAGKDQLQDLCTTLSGYVVGGEPETGDKITRAEPYSAQVEAGNVHLVEGAWNLPYVVELEGFPSSAHDDQVDASSGAFNYLSDGIGAARLRAAYGSHNS
jgi:predicted phage terminase large subunit-like protein